MVQTRSASGLTPARPPPTTPTPSRTRVPSWVHVPSTLALIWMAVSLPLVAWDTGYVLLRPLSMPGGSLHWPLWQPYALYGEVDHMYGFKQYNAGNGFTSAQGTMNLLETAMYGAYLYVWWTRGKPLGGRYNGRKGVSGRAGGLAVVLGFAAAVMTLSKTLLYWLNEYFSSFDNIGHNSPFNLFVLWIVPNGAWLIFPTAMIYTMSEEIISAVSQASGRTAKYE